MGETVAVFNISRPAKSKSIPNTGVFGMGLFDRCGSVWWGHRIAGRPVGDPDARQEGKADWAAGGKAEAHTSVLHRGLSAAAGTNKKPCCLHRPHENKAPILLISAVRFGPGHGKARGSSRKT